MHKLYSYILSLSFQYYSGLTGNLRVSKFCRFGTRACFYSKRKVTGTDDTCAGAGTGAYKYVRLSLGVQVLQPLFVNNTLHIRISLGYCSICGSVLELHVLDYLVFHMLKYEYLLVHVLVLEYLLMQALNCLLM